MNKYILPFLSGLLIGFLFCFLFKPAFMDPNFTAKYKNGHPANCRAIVAANIESYYRHKYPISDIMDSLERNCGINGYSWGK